MASLTLGLHPCLVLRRSLHGGAGVGHQAWFPGLLRLLSQTHHRLLQLHRILATPNSLFSVTAKGLPQPWPAQRLAGTPSPLPHHSSQAWPDLVSSHPYQRLWSLTQDSRQGLWTSALSLLWLISAGKRKQDSFCGCTG